MANREDPIIKIRSFQRRALDWTVRHHPFLHLDRRAEFFVQLFEKHLPQQSRILDIGGGWGFYAKPLKERSHQVTVLDVTRPGLQKAPAVVLYEPQNPFPFADKTFDASLLITMLHHTPDPEAILREARRVTRGLLIVVEDLYRHGLGRLWTVFRDQLYNFEFFGHPKQFKSRDEWQKLFEKQGMTLLETREVYTRLAGLRILNGVFVLKASA